MSQRNRRRRLLLSASAALLVGGGLAACGGDSPSSDGGDSDTALEVPVDGGNAERGAELVSSNGCVACHALDENRVGPKWNGLAGSMVTLDDGSTVLADRDYLVLAITDPAAQKVDGFQVSMPANRLTAAEVADVVAYLESLGSPVPATSGSSAP